MILLDLNINQEALLFLPYSGFTYKSLLSVQNYVQPADYDSSFEFSYNSTKINITTVRVEALFYDQKNSLNDCLNDPESWYFDFDTQLLYVHVANDVKPYDRLIGTLRSSSFANRLYITATEQAYLPLLESNVTVQKKADFLKYNKMSFSRQKVKLNNAQGDFDSFFNAPIPSSLATISFLADDDIESGTPQPVYSGIVSEDTLSTSSFGLTLDDIRALQSITIPRALITSTDFPNIDDDLDRSVLATGYGILRGIPAICTNGKIKTGNVNYTFADFSTSISQIYVENDGYWTPVSAVSSSSGAFVLSAANARNANGDPKPCKVDATLYNIGNPGDIIEDLNTRYLDIPFDASEYDLTEWATEQALLTDIGILLNKELDIFKYIEQIQNGSNYGFIYDILGDGKRTLRVDYADRILFRTVQEVELIEKQKVSERDFSEYAAEVRINYAQDYTTKAYKNITNTDFFVDAVRLYRKPQRETVNTLLTNSTGADEKGLILATEYQTVRSRFRFKVSGSWQYDVKLFDILSVDFGYIGERVAFDDSGEPIYINDRLYVGVQRVQVINIKYDLISNEAEFIVIQKAETA